MKVTTMNISLPRDLAQFVRRRVREGQFSTASEVIRAGLRLLQRWESEALADEDEFDRAKVAEAIEGLRRISETQTLGDDLSLRDLIDDGRP